MSNETVVVNEPKMNDDLAKAINSALDPADIRAAILAEAHKQTATSEESVAALAAAEKAAADKKTAEDAAIVTDTTATTGFSRTETIGGREYLFEAGSELELERMVSNAYKIAFGVQSTPQEVAPVVDPSVAAAEAATKAAEEAAAKVELELQFKRGDISAADYVERSGAVRDYLAKQGIPVEELKAVVEKKQDQQDHDSWVDATTEFKRTVGKDWPGGERNRQMIGMKIAELGLIDAPDKVAALGKAYAEMKRTNMIFDVEADPNAAPVTTPVVETTPVVAVPAVVAPAIPPPAPVRSQASSSSMFDTSSGVSGTAPIVPANAGAEVKIDPNATPTEIMDAWKKAQIASGRNPDDALKEAFGVRR